jgi:hypothetical protein
MGIRPNRDLRYRGTRNRKARPKTFKTEEEAHAYAKEHEITNYELVNLRFESNPRKKIRIELKK